MTGREALKTSSEQTRPFSLSPSRGGAFSGCFGTERRCVTPESSGSSVCGDLDDAAV